MDLYFTITECAKTLRERLDGRAPEVAVVLGSALGAFADAVDDPVTIPYSDLPHFRPPTTPGHPGLLTAGTVAGRHVAVLAGRIHGYEGYAAQVVTLPMRVLALAGVQTVVLTNSAGGVDPSYRAGDLMIIDDHLNLTGDNPLRGPNDDRLGMRFPDMTFAYDRAHVSTLEKAALSLGRPVHRGVYAGLSGPSYETPAEVRMLRAMGAHAVGMSTVHEAIVARHAGLRVAGVSVIANAAASAETGPLAHDEVVRVGREASGQLAELLRGFCAM